MPFTTLYHYLVRQTFTPTVKAKCRVYMAKDLRNYDTRYHAVMHQIAGAQWNRAVQNVSTDTFLLIKMIKAFIIIISLSLFAYAYIL